MFHWPKLGHMPTLKTLIGKWEQHWHDYLDNSLLIALGRVHPPSIKIQLQLTRKRKCGFGYTGICVESEMMEKPADTFPVLIYL